MKKWFKIILPMFVFAFSLFMPGMKANAGTIATINAAAGTNQITVSGTADTGVLSVVVFVYDSTGTTLLKMESVAVDSNHAYTDTISAVPGTYEVKVLDDDWTAVTRDGKNAAHYENTVYITDGEPEILTL